MPNVLAGTNLINYYKRRKQAEVIMKIQQFQQCTGACSVFPRCFLSRPLGSSYAYPHPFVVPLVCLTSSLSAAPFCLEPVPPIQDYLLGVQVKDEEELYQLSLLREEKQAGGGAWR